MAPLPRNQRCHSQKPVLLPFLVYSFFAECGSKSTLMFGGAGGCAQGPVHCCWLYTCLGLLVAVKVQPRSTGILASFGFGAVGLHAFCLPSLRTLHIYIYIYHFVHTRRGHKYDTGSCCRIRPFFCPPRVSAMGHKPELQKWKQQGGEIYAESTGRNEGNEMQSEAEGKKSYNHPPPCPSKSMLFFANWRLAGIQI